MSQNNVEKNEGKVVVVTGSSKGIGKAIAKEFAKNGYSAVLNARNDDELRQAIEEITREIKGDDNKISFIVGDISQEQTCKTLLDEAINRFGRVDVLVNNAGVAGPSKKSSEVTVNDWNEVIDINLKGAFLCYKRSIKTYE